MSELILVLDAGTTSTRAMLFGAAGEPRGVAQAELTQHYPRPGWVEHEASEIWDKTLACAVEMVERAGGAERIAAIRSAPPARSTIAPAQARVLSQISAASCSTQPGRG